MKRMLSPTVAALAGLLLLGGHTIAQEARVRLTSDQSEFDYKTGTYHFWSNVVVRLPGFFNLNCGDLVTAQQGETNRIDTLVATNNVVVEIVRPSLKPGGEPVIIRAYCDHFVYTATNEVVTLTGTDPRIVAPQGTTRAEKLVYELPTGRIRAFGRHATDLNLDMFKNSGFLRRSTNKPAAEIPPR
jgi:lipopolysaccharide export system protein LptA